MEAARAHEACLLVGGERRAAPEVSRDALQHLGVPGVVLEELARQLHRVPGHAVDAGDARVVDARQQVVQPVAELVEQRQHVVVRQQRRLIRRRRQEVAHQVRHRQRRAARQALAADALVHPGAAALVRARVGVEVEAADRLAAGTDVEKSRVGVPHRCALPLADGDAEQPFGDLEQPAEHARQREVGPQLLLRHREPLALQPLGVEAHVPGGQRPARERLELGELGTRGGARRGRQLVQERQYLLDAVRHAGGECVLGVVAEVEQPRRFVAAAQDLLHHRGVVPAPGGRPLVGGARGPGLVEVAPQRLGLRIRHHRHVGRLVQRQQPAGAPLLVGPAPRLLDERVIQTGQLLRIGDGPRPAVGRVQHVLLELVPAAASARAWRS